MLRLQRTHGRGPLRAVLLAGALAGLGAAGGPATALASKLKEEFAPFINCPTTKAAVCAVAKTTSGEFQMGSKKVPITSPITLQGGLGSTLIFEELPLIAPRVGPAISETPLTVPGGLIGIEGLGGEVSATAYLAGAPSSILLDRVNLLSGKGTAIVLPLKIKLSNPLLGEECWIGSESHPIALHLTDGTTAPPWPNKPVTGVPGTEGGAGKGKILVISGNTLVDNSFAVPGASGCGTNPLLVPIVTALVDLDSGLPSPAGHNAAVMSGSIEQTEVAYAERYAKPPREKKH